MPDLSRESVQYVCTRFRSPHIARKYGHKINSDYQENRENNAYSASDWAYCDNTGFLLAKVTLIAHNTPLLLRTPSLKLWGQGLRHQWVKCIKSDINRVFSFLEFLSPPMMWWRRSIIFVFRSQRLMMSRLSDRPDGQSPGVRGSPGGRPSPGRRRGNTGDTMTPSHIQPMIK